MVMIDLPDLSICNDEQWHVAVTRPGMFPFPEARCPCDKSACGLVIPSSEVACEIHHVHAALHQAHSSEDCPSNRRRGLFGQRRRNVSH
jgi:hypothetical protein